MNESASKSLLYIITKLSPLQKLYEKRVTEMDDIDLILFDIFCQIKALPNQNGLNVDSFRQLFSDKDLSLYDAFDSLVMLIDNKFNYPIISSSFSNQDCEPVSHFEIDLTTTKNFNNLLISTIKSKFQIPKFKYLNYLFIKTTGIKSSISSYKTIHLDCKKMSLFAFVVNNDVSISHYVTYFYENEDWICVDNDKIEKVDQMVLQLPEDSPQTPIVFMCYTSSFDLTKTYTLIDKIPKSLSFSKSFSSQLQPNYNSIKTPTSSPLKKAQLTFSPTSETSTFHFTSSPKKNIRLNLSDFSSSQMEICNKESKICSSFAEVRKSLPLKQEILMYHKTTINNTWEELEDIIQLPQNSNSIDILFVKKKEQSLFRAFLHCPKIKTLTIKCKEIEKISFKAKFSDDQKANDVKYLIFILLNQILKLKQNKPENIRIFKRDSIPIYDFTHVKDLSDTIIFSLPRSK